MTHREIGQRYADLPVDLSDLSLLLHLVHVAWHILPDIESEDAGRRMLAASKLKDALKAVIPERPGDTVAADGMRRAIRSGRTTAQVAKDLRDSVAAGRDTTADRETIDGHEVIFEPSDEGGYTVFATKLDGCVSEGDTREEARENMRRAIKLWLEE